MSYFIIKNTAKMAVNKTRRTKNINDKFKLSSLFENDLNTKIQATIELSIIAGKSNKCI